MIKEYEDDVVYYSLPDNFDEGQGDDVLYYCVVCKKTGTVNEGFFNDMDADFCANELCFSKFCDKL